MKIKILLFALLLILLPACSMTGMLGKIPNQGFKKFTYARTGNVTSAHINANNCSVENGAFKCKDIKVEGSYPFVNFLIEVEEYSRDAE